MHRTQHLIAQTALTRSWKRKSLSYLIFVELFAAVFTVVSFQLSTEQIEPGNQVGGHASACKADWTNLAPPRSVIWPTLSTWCCEQKATSVLSTSTRLVSTEPLSRTSRRTRSHTASPLCERPRCTVRRQELNCPPCRINGAIKCAFRRVQELYVLTWPPGGDTVDGSVVGHCMIIMRREGGLLLGVPASGFLSPADLQLAPDQPEEDAVFGPHTTMTVLQ